MLDEAGVRAAWSDHTCPGRRINIAFKGNLREEQIPATEEMLKHDIGVLSATTAFGKTVIAAKLIANRKVNTLVLKHRRQLLSQWTAKLSEFLEIDEGLPAPYGARSGPVPPEWFLGCLERAIEGAEHVLAGIFLKAHFWKAHTDKPFNERQRAMINRLLNDFEGKLTSSKWAKLAKCSQDTALRDIDDLVKRGILEPQHRPMFPKFAGVASLFYGVLGTIPDRGFCRSAYVLMAFRS